MASIARPDDGREPGPHKPEHESRKDPVTIYSDAQVDAHRWLSPTPGEDNIGPSSPSFPGDLVLEREFPEYRH